MTKRIRVPGSLFVNVAGVGLSISFDELFQWGRALCAKLTGNPMPPMTRATEEADGEGDPAPANEDAE